MKTFRMTYTLSALLGLAVFGLCQLSGVTSHSADVKKTISDANPPQGVKPLDWGQWGGSSIRNNTPEGKNIPTEWNLGSFDKDGKWVKDESKNVRWVSHLGSQSYGNPVVANGQVYVGTNNGAGYLKRYP